MTQAERILLHLQTHDGITPLDALREYGCFRLAARISDLKADGHPIVSDRLHLESGKTVAVYRLVGSLQQGFGL